MEKGDTIKKYLTKFIQCRDELGSVKIIVVDYYLVSLALLGPLKSWHIYQDSINGRDELPDWEQFWSNLVQEEFKRNTRDGSSSKEDDEENCAMDCKEKKENGNKSYSKSQTGKEGKKRDMSKVKFF